MKLVMLCGRLKVQISGRDPEVRKNMWMLIKKSRPKECQLALASQI